MSSAIASPSHAKETNGKLPSQPELALSLVMECARATQDPSRNPRISELLAASPDWSLVQQKADAHGIEPVVYRLLAGHREAIPAEAWPGFSTGHERNIRRSLLLTAELIRVLKLLDDNGVTAVPFKGPTLAAAAYGDVAQRQFSDLDILIHPSQWVRAREALILGGYTPEYTLSGRRERALLATGYECAFVHENSHVAVEVQWALLPRFYAVHCAMEDMIARSLFIEFQGRRVRTLDPNDLLLAVSVHAAKHLWRRLCWLMDIAQVVRTQPVDWGVVQARAREWGVERMLITSLHVSRHLFGADIPGPARAWLENDLEANSLAREVSRYIVQDEPIDPESPAYFHLISRLRERRLDRGKFFWRLAVTPSFGEWSAVRLPDWLFPLYRGVRIGRLVGRALKK